MKQSWWKKQTELDDAQQHVIALPKDGRYVITGPPGSGKTNLLLLRAMFLSGSGLKDVLFLTVGRTLQEFIVTGVGSKGLIATDKVLTFRKWVMQFMGEHSSGFMKSPPSGSYDETRTLYAQELEKVSKKLPAIYNAILIDEVQDLTEIEVNALARLTPRMMVAGDDRQQIFEAGEGLKAALALGMKHTKLEYHYRIGTRICEAADIVLPPADGSKPLTQTCNYDETALPSSRKLCSADSVEAQVLLALAEMRIQLRAYPDDTIGILIPKKKLFRRIRAVLDASEIAPLVAYHDPDSGDTRDFLDSKRIFVMTIHSAKGTEFRAVHIIGAEEMRGHVGTRKIVFTAFTRAKTSLRVYHTGNVTGYVDSAFATPSTPKLSELFP